MEEAPENGKELSHSAHANGMNKRIQTYRYTYFKICHSLLFLKFNSGYSPSKKENNSINVHTV
jgi:hypothetical protein